MSPWSPTSICALLASLFITLLYKPLAPSESPFHSPSARKQNVLIVTAHPDDECFFFAPTILALQDRNNAFPDEPPTGIFSLCLSNGGQDGLGSAREQELDRSLDVLGIEKGNRWVLDHP
jgi:N-acetylglucosaminylphosphatidylinositol deacetylase